MLLSAADEFEKQCSFSFLVGDCDWPTSLRMKRLVSIPRNWKHSNEGFRERTVYMLCLQKTDVETKGKDTCNTTSLGIHFTLYERNCTQPSLDRAFFFWGPGKRGTPPPPPSHHISASIKAMTLRLG